MSLQHLKEELKLMPNLKSTQKSINWYYLKKYTTKPLQKNDAPQSLSSAFKIYIINYDDNIKLAYKNLLLIKLSIKQL